MSDVDFTRWATELDDAIGGLRREIDDAQRRLTILEQMRVAMSGSLPAVVPPVDHEVVAKVHAAPAPKPVPRKATKPKAAAGTKPKKYHVPTGPTGQVPTNKGTSKYDLAEVARIANAALDVGESGAAAVSAHYKTSAANGYQLMTNARKAGFLILAKQSPPQRGGMADPETPAATMPPLQEIADTVLEAAQAGRRSVQTLIDRFDCSRTQANEWIALARTKGLLPPRDEPLVPAPEQPMQLVRHTLNGALA